MKTRKRKRYCEVCDNPHECDHCMMMDAVEDLKESFKETGSYKILIKFLDWLNDGLDHIRDCL
ncbi:MAG: hypothetical protein OSJ72_19320 [Lachnospiraceae bacterium]|nr:hypothetical protein [Lachnospiraceae bacterium]